MQSEEVKEVVQPALREISTDTETVRAGSDVSSWWIGFTNLIRDIQSPSTVTTDIPEPDLEWAFTNASEIVNSKGHRSGELILAYISDNDPGVHVLLTFLEETQRLPVSVKISGILREVVNPKHGRYRNAAVKQVLTKDYFEVLMRTLVTLYKEAQNVTTAQSSSSTRDTSPSTHSSNHFEATITNILWFLSAVAVKDQGFSIKVVYMSKVKFYHGLFKSMYLGKPTAHYPLLKILRILCKNSKSSALLGKDKVMQTIRKVFSSLNNKPSLKFQLAMDCLVSLTRDKSNCRRFLKAGLLTHVIRTLQAWLNWKGNGLFKLTKAIVNILSHVAETKAGKSSLVKSGALGHLKRFCEESCPHDKCFDDVILKSNAILSLCYRKHKLPLVDLASPCRFISTSFDQTAVETNINSGSSSEDEDDLPTPIKSSTTKEEDDDDDENETTMFANTSKNSDGADNLDSSSLDDDENDSNLEDDVENALALVNNNSARSSVRRHGSSKSGIIEDTESSLYNFSEFAHLTEELEGKLATSTDVCTLDSTHLFHGLNNLEEKDLKSQVSIPKAHCKFTWIAENQEYGSSTKSTSEARSIYSTICSRVKSVIPFVKIAYPDFVQAYSAKKFEHLLSATDHSLIRNKVLDNMTRICAEMFKPKVVYDLDELLKVSKEQGTSSTSMLLGNSDEDQAGKYDRKMHLQFESRFESGNLRKAIQIGEREYNLVLTSDVNSTGHNQWFYFQVSNMQEDFQYTFNVINCMKGNSQFNFGMQPVMFSVLDAMEGKPGWNRCGTDVCYYRNGFRNFTGKRSKVYYTASFSLNFRKKGDIVYLAYHYPFTYSRLMAELWRMMKEVKTSKRLLVTYNKLCQSLNQNEVPSLTVTGTNTTTSPIELREVIVFTSRVHPGETNASWVMLGILHSILFDTNLDGILQRYIFKVVPMLNVEGVINGNHRCGLTNEDLNRRWKHPSKTLHPEIYHTKMIIEYCSKMRNKTPILFCDLHGHSRKKNTFLYGCSRARSWLAEDRIMPENPQALHTLPEAMRRCPAFCISYCNFEVKKSRETTARITLWRDYGITRSYTLETSYCGCDRGPYKGLSLGTNQLIEIGQSLCHAVQDLNELHVTSASCYDIHSPPLELNEGKESMVNLVNFDEAILQLIDSECIYLTELSNYICKRFVVYKVT